LSVTLTLAERAPTTVGVNSTLNEQDPPGTIVADEQRVATSEKSPAFVPVIEIPEVIRFAVPGLVISIVVEGLEVPTT